MNVELCRFGKIESGKSGLNIERIIMDSDHDCVNPNCASPIGTMCENADKCHGYMTRKDYLQRLSGEKESGAGRYSEKQKEDTVWIMTRENTKEYGQYIELDHEPSVDEIRDATVFLYAKLEYVRRGCLHVAMENVIIRSNKCIEQSDPLADIEAAKQPRWTIGYKMKCVVDGFHCPSHWLECGVSGNPITDQWMIWQEQKHKSDGMRSYAGVARKLEPTAENLALVLRLYGTISGESAEILGHNTAKMAEVFTSTIETRDYYKSAYEQQREIITGCIKQIRALTSENARLRTKSVDIESAKMLMHDKDVCIAALMAGNDDQREKLRQAEAIIRKATERAEKAEAVINRCRRNKAARYRLCVKRFSQHGAATAAGEGTKQC